MNMSLNAYSRQHRPLRPDTTQVQAAFDRAALTYDAAAVVQRQAAQGLLAHLLAYAAALNIPLPLSAPVCWMLVAARLCLALAGAALPRPAFAGAGCCASHVA